MAISQWVRPFARPDIINNLVNGVGNCMIYCTPLQADDQIKDRYNPSNTGILEDYLYHQIRSGEYDCLANLAVLKLLVKKSL